MNPETRRGAVAAALLALALPAAALAEIPVTPLRLHSALPIVGPPGLQPSGLTLCAERLLMVSDRHDQVLFELSLNGDEAEARSLPLPPLPEPPAVEFPAGMALFQQLQQQLLGRRFDWEGISCDAAGNRYLASEAQAAVLRVSAEGAPQWLRVALFNPAYRAGLFQRHNALLEGIAWDGRGLQLAAEREGRGLLQLIRRDGEWSLQSVQPLPTTPGLDPERASDLAGLWWEAGRLYTLERNQSAICRRHPANGEVERCWTYRAQEWDEALGYEGVRYGQGEGVARWGSLLYLVLDNNDRARRSDPTDRRPLLLRFHLPDQWQVGEHLGPMGGEQPAR